MHKELLLIAALTFGGLAGCAVARDQETVGEYVDDKAIAGKIKARFAEDPTVSAMAIEVEVLKGQVQLTGFAKSQAEKDRAGQIARDTSGVSSVRNDIIVRS